MGNNRLYAVMDAETGKLVSNITNSRRKYWDRKYNALAAIQNSRYHGIHKDLKLVVFELVEVEEDGK